MFNNLLFSFVELNKGSYPFSSLPLYQQNQPSYFKQSICTSAISINSMIKQTRRRRRRKERPWTLISCLLCIVYIQCWTGTKLMFLWGRTLAPNHSGGENLMLTKSSSYYWCHSWSTTQPANTSKRSNMIPIGSFSILNMGRHLKSTLRTVKGIRTSAGRQTRSWRRTFQGSLWFALLCFPLSVSPWGCFWLPIQQ